MSLESILEKIFGETDAKAEEIIQEANAQADVIVSGAKEEAQRLYRQLLEKERLACERDRQRLVVNARLEQRKSVLGAKQELIGAVFERLKSGLKRADFKKQQVLTDGIKEVPEEMDLYLEKLRHDYEAEIAQILFS